MAYGGYNAGYGPADDAEIPTFDGTPNPSRTHAVKAERRVAVVRR